MRVFLLRSRLQRVLDGVFGPSLSGLALVLFVSREAVDSVACRAVGGDDAVFDELAYVVAECASGDVEFLADAFGSSVAAFDEGEDAFGHFSVAFAVFAFGGGFGDFDGAFAADDFVDDGEVIWAVWVECDLHDILSWCFDIGG